MTDRSLREEIALRRASIADARREFADGELDQGALDQVTARELAAIAACETALAVPAPPLPGRRARRWLLWVGLFCVAGGVTAALVTGLAHRQPGSSITGGVDSSTSQRVEADLVTAELDQSDGHLTPALAAYDAALALEPTNVEALTQSGWLSFSAGSTAHDATAVTLGVTRLAEAVVLAPRDPDPRLYYAITAASTPGDRALAIRQFRRFLRLHPPRALRAVAEPWLQKYGI